MLGLCTDTGIETQFLSVVQLVGIAEHQVGIVVILLVGSILAVLCIQCILPPVHASHVLVEVRDAIHEDIVENLL